MQPSQAYFGDGASAATDDDAGVSGQRHEQVSRVSHAAWHDDGRRPVGGWHVCRWDDAEHLPTSRNGSFSGNPGGWAAAAADERDVKLRQKLSGLGGPLEGWCARFRASKD